MKNRQPPPCCPGTSSQCPTCCWCLRSVFCARVSLSGEIIPEHMSVLPALNGSGVLTPSCTALDSSHPLFRSRCAAGAPRRLVHGPLLRRPLCSRPFIEFQSLPIHAETHRNDSPAPPPAATFIAHAIARRSQSASGNSGQGRVWPAALRAAVRGAKDVSLTAWVAVAMNSFLFSDPARVKPLCWSFTGFGPCRSRRRPNESCHAEPPPAAAVGHRFMWGGNSTPFATINSF